MILFYLSEQQLRDRLFIQNFVHHYKVKGKAVLLHAPFGDSIRETRFVTKRISTLLSENMVYNNAFSADQRNLVSKEQGDLLVRKEMLLELIAPIQLLAIGPIIKGVEGPVLADAEHLFWAVRNALPIEEVRIFPNNPLSPLGRKRIEVKSEAEIAPLRKVYEEEAKLFELALRLRPVTIVSSTDFS